MIRFDDWDQRFWRYCQTVMNAHFRWGQLDCGLFALDAVETITGKDLASDFRGHYRSRKEALNYLFRKSRKSGFASGVREMMGRYGLEEIKPSLAQRGDVILFQAGNAKVIGVVALDGIHIWSMGRTGLIRTPIGQAILAWRV
jgi:hypothetical protein